ncbi:hypothetical protein KP509_16G082800 [Ceratopteris richardii]|uniref:Protein kinase domain-containing protein n=1 Tax=Ceratopteris richardii TaxID=49495 RepID=A0A8T2T0H2_CERRI|nr:hypothetical protein KP509_16G082800 [Ceratopteris richardii]
MMSSESTRSVTVWGSGLKILILYISTCCLVLWPSFGTAVMAPNFIPVSVEYRERNLTRSSVYSILASSSMPSTTCKGVQKLGGEKQGPFQHWECISSVQSDCEHITCIAPYTQSSNGSHCHCVLPIQVQLALDVPLDSLFEDLPTLISDISSSILLSQNQTRIVGLNAESDDESKSIVDINLVPLDAIFDNVTASKIFKKFENHEVFSNSSIFRNYTLLYLHYPGLYPHEKPLSVDVENKNESIGDGTIAIIIVSSIIGAAAILGAAFMAFLKFNKKATAVGSAKSNHKSIFKYSSGYGSPFPESISPAIDSFCLSARKFSLLELDRATDSFDVKNVLGQGGFGQVFRGKLEDGDNIAVKVITHDNQQRAKEFMAEVEMLCRLHHRNLVKLIGVCTEGHHYCLIYELIPNGSVDSHLHDTSENAVLLDWNTRLKIALGAARGLAYLHEDANPRVIHRDFKASNILLDEDFTPKIADFGLAKAAPDEENGYISTTVMGTFGYVAPEYAMTGHLLVKSDVYSYGVVLLELLSGRKPIDMSQPAGGENLVTWARSLLSDKEGLEKLMDPRLVGSVPFDSFSRVAAIASMCVQPDVSHRPFMGEVVQALKLVSSCTEGSAAVSPQNSAGASDHGEHPQSTGSSSGVNISNEGSFVSFEYDSGTTSGGRVGEKHDIHCILFSKSNQSCEDRRRAFRRHSFSGLCTRLNYSWTLEKYCTCVSKTKSVMPQDPFSTSI